MHQFLDSVISSSFTASQILCLMTAWTIIILFLWSIWLAAKEGVTTIKRLHEIPCSTCQFFTGFYQLKCPVHPKDALTEEAINCSDYCPRRGNTVC